VNWDGAERNVGWLATYNVIEDGYGNALVVVTESYQGIQ
jgi:hypothetical protein